VKKRNEKINKTSKNPKVIKRSRKTKPRRYVSSNKKARTKIDKTKSNNRKPAKITENYFAKSENDYDFYLDLLNEVEKTDSDLALDLSTDLLSSFYPVDDEVKVKKYTKTIFSIGLDKKSKIKNFSTALDTPIDLSDLRNRDADKVWNELQPYFQKLFSKIRSTKKSIGFISKIWTFTDQKDAVSMSLKEIDIIPDDFNYWTKKLVARTVAEAEKYLGRFSQSCYLTGVEFQVYFEIAKKKKDKKKK
jgi:hypothetical protein